MKKLEIEDKILIDRFLKDKFEASDYNFTNQLLWGVGENTHYEIKDDTLILRSTYDDKEYYYMPISSNTQNILKATSQIVENGGQIMFIPERYKNIFEDEYILNPTRNSFDYIYSAKDLESLVGRKYTKKKNKINKFIKTYKYEYEKITTKNINEIIAFQKDWYDKQDKIEILINENTGLNIILNNYEYLKLIGGMIKVDGKVVAYAIGEIITPTMALVHIEKADEDYIGAYQLINKLFVKNECKGYKYINREDDFGKVGLRDAKMSYHPTRLLEKYEIINKK